MRFLPANLLTLTEPINSAYQPRPNLFRDAKLIARHQTYSFTPAANVNEVYASLAVRWNIAQHLHEF